MNILRAILLLLSLAVSHLTGQIAESRFDFDSEQRVSWDFGLLQSADSPAGPWDSHPTSLSPYVVDYSLDRQFFRLLSGEGSSERRVQLMMSGYSGHLQNAVIHHDNVVVVGSVEEGLFLSQLSTGQHRLTLEHPWYDSYERLYSVAQDGSLEVLPPIEPLFIGKTFDAGGESFRIVGHGGGSPSRLSNSHWSSWYSRSKGVYWLELDCLVAADGVPICGHDWDAVTRVSGLGELATSEELGDNGIMTVPKALEFFSHIIFDLTPSGGGEVTRAVVDYLESNYPERIRDDVLIQVYKPDDYAYIRGIDPAIRISFNLAAWSAWGYYGDGWNASGVLGGRWRGALASVIAETDFYVINPASVIDEALLSFLRENGLNNTFVGVVSSYDPTETELARLAGLGVMPMIQEIDRLPE